MKDDINCAYNGGGVVYLLKNVAIHFNLKVQLKWPPIWSPIKERGSFIILQWCKFWAKEGHLEIFQ